MAFVYFTFDDPWRIKSVIMGVQNNSGAYQAVYEGFKILLIF